MEIRDGSDDEIVTDNSHNTEESADTKGVGTHFWLERIYINEEGAE